MAADGEEIIGVRNSLGGWVIVGTEEDVVSAKGFESSEAVGAMAVMGALRDGKAYGGGSLQVQLN